MYVESLRYKIGNALTRYRFIFIALGAISIPLLATFPAWHVETDDTGNDVSVKPFPSQPLTKFICGILAAASFFALLSSLWQHVAAVAFTSTVRKISYGSVKSEVGAAAMGLGWASLIMYIGASCAMFVMILSISMLDDLLEDDDD